ncbi:hypothetical protein R1flu_013121 [Riccia fluitans]|uniref:Uncharacterized protein n=1 Tax=Riccia fluitans TaxID=41844 RepID=A0ABD1XGS5_9MARC
MNEPLPKSPSVRVLAWRPPSVGSLVASVLWRKIRHQADFEPYALMPECWWKMWPGAHNGGEVKLRLSPDWGIVNPSECAPHLRKL